MIRQFRIKAYLPVDEWRFGRHGIHQLGDSAINRKQGFN